VTGMGLRKKECRKYADPGVTINRNNGLLCMEQAKYIVRTALKNIAGRRILILYFYSREKALNGYCKPVYTLFQVKDDYITLEQSEDGTDKWRTASLYNLFGCYFTDKCVFFTVKDKRRVTRYCNNPQRNGLSALNGLQDSIKKDRMNERIKALDRKTLKRMETISPVPRDFKGWIHREVLPAYIFYEYHRSKKPMSGYCTACQHDVLVSGAKHNKPGRCPRCKRTVTFKAVGISKRVWDRATVQILQKKGENELLLRIFKVSKLYQYGHENDLNIWENARIYAGWDDAKRLTVEPYYYAYIKGILTHWQKGERPKFSNYQYNFECDVCGKLYCRNLGETLAGTPWQYSQLEQFCSIIDSEPMEVIPYLRAYTQYPMIEYLVKLGLGNLTTNVVYRSYLDPKIINVHGKNIKEVLKVNTEDIRHLQSVNADIKQLNRLQDFRAREGRFEKELYQWCLNNDVPYHEVERPLKYTTGRKLLRYIGEQDARDKLETDQSGRRHYGKITDILRDYNDYFRNGDELSYDFSDSFVLFPRHLKDAHDLADNLVEMRRRKAREREENRRKKEATPKIAALYKSLLRKFRFTQDGLTVIPPKSAEDIVFEGHALHHCVGGRYSSHANGNCVILFIRKKDSIAEPFCTMEVSNGRVIQVRGYDNKEPTPEVKRFVSLWEQEKLNAGSGQKAA